MATFLELLTLTLSRDNIPLNLMPVLSSGFKLGDSMKNVQPDWNKNVSVTSSIMACEESQVDLDRGMIS